MTDFALEPLLAPIEGGETPAGPDLEYDADFMALERAAAPTAERVMGDEVKEAKEPDWADVADKATALLQRSKDLRAAVALTNAWVHRSSLPGWAAGLELIHGLLDTYWDDVHPQLDADDNNDPTERVNAVVTLANIQGALGYLQSAPFVQSPRLGRYCLRDLHIANGEINPTGTNGDSAPPSVVEIEACCMDCAEEDLAATRDAINASLEHARAIDQLFTDRIGTAGPDLRPLLDELQALKKFIDPQAAKRMPDAAEPATEGDSEGGGKGEGAPAAGGNTPAAVDHGRINGPQDVIRQIDAICDYYARVEPSSPVPLLLQRAKRLVGKSFGDLLQDLAPSGINELKAISGGAADAAAE